MRNNNKPCKGTGKAIGHGCGRPQLFRKYGLGIECGCYQKWLRSTPEGNEVIQRCSLSAHKKVKKEKAKETREYKQRNKSIAKLKQEARAEFQKWIRLRDVDELCVCCGENSETWDGGHYYKAELYSGVIFNEVNVNKQRVYCNKHLHGNEGEYRKGLIKKYGEDVVLELDKLAIETKGYEWTREELIDIKNKYRQKIKEISKY